jgi:hypothetical protein
MFIKLALTLFFKRQQHRKLSWLDKDSDKDQSQFDEHALFAYACDINQHHSVKSLILLLLSVNFTSKTQVILHVLIINAMYSSNI